jgi:ankyrin repeat protein
MKDIINHKIIAQKLNLVRELVKKVNINELDLSGFSPLAYAVQVSSDDLKENLEIVKLLLDNGADPYQKIRHAKNGRICETTPLNLACELGHTECIKLINQFISAKNNKNQSIFHTPRPASPPAQITGDDVPQAGHVKRLLEIFNGNTGCRR